MNDIHSRINGNANWRADTGKTADDVAAEMNAARIVLAPGSRYTLIGVQKVLGVQAVAVLEYTLRQAIIALQASQQVADQVQAVAIRQMLDALKTATGPDFGLSETQAAIASLSAILPPATVGALQALGISHAHPPVTAAEVTSAWDWLSAFWERETLVADLQRELHTLSGLTSDGAEFAAKLVDLKTLLT